MVIPWRFVGRPGFRAAEMLINVDKSKTDQFGVGRLVRHDKRGDNPQHCIVQRMEKWLTKCRDKLGATELDYVFQIGDRVLVSDTEMTLAMKRTVEHLGMSSAKISAHSLRYGGATMLAAAGIPQYVIAYFGGWKADSKSLQIYMHLGAEAVAQASSVMASGFMRSLTATRIRAAELAA